MNLKLSIVTLAAVAMIGSAFAQGAGPAGAQGGASAGKGKGNRQMGGRRGGGAMNFDAPVLARIPFDPALREASDAGTPVLEAAPTSEASEAIRALAEAVQSRRQGQIRKALTVL